MMKLKIDNDTLVEEFFECTRLVGIVAPVKAYQFTWHVNRTMQFKFRANNSLEIQLNKKGRSYFFPVYEYMPEGSFLVHYLYNNHNDGEYLLPEFKHLDFLWLVKGDEMDNDEFQALLQSVKAIPGVQLVNEMSHEKIKHKQHLIL